MPVCCAEADYKPRIMVPAMASETTPFGEKIEALLDRRGWTQDRLSEASDPNVSQGQISNYKYGRRNPSRETVRIIARAFVSDLDAEEAERQYRLTVNALLTAAGFSEDFPGEGDGAEPLPRVIERAGYDPQQFGLEDLDNLQRGVNTMIAGILAEKRLREGRD